MTDLIEKLEDLEKWKDAPLELVEEVFGSVYPEPERGPWYWRNSVWRKWNHILSGIEQAHRKGNWLYLLDWLYFGDIPEMIHSNPQKAIIAALRAKETGEQTDGE